MGDFFDPETRIIINVLEMCNITAKLELIDLRGEKNDTTELQRAVKNPSNCYPMMIHKRCKIIGQIDAMLNYLKNTYPTVD
jgi:glutathione S-transferase